MKFEVWPGPMEGVGRGEFAGAAAMLKLAPRWMTPFIRITEVIPAERKIFKSIVPYLDSGVPVTVQLMGNNANLLRECASTVTANPAVSGINLNFGCPSSRVVKHGAGGAMLKNPALLADLCKTVADGVPGGTVSVKLRSGFINADEMEDIIPQLTDSGVVDKIFFHYRTVSENYSSLPLPLREERIKRAVELCGSVPLIANGDISSVADAERVVDFTGAAGVMIARPWLRDPFLLRRFSDPDAPAADRGRELFFSALKESGITGGALIELAKLLWGVKSPEFQRCVESLQSQD